MPIRVILGVVNDSIRRYVKGDIITGLPQEEESRLVSLGVAELIPTDDELINNSEPSALKGKRKKRASVAENDMVNVEFNPDELIKK